MGFGEHIAISAQLDFMKAEVIYQTQVGPGFHHDIPLILSLLLFALLCPISALPYSVCWLLSCLLRDVQASYCLETELVCMTQILTLPAYHKVQVSHSLNHRGFQ